VHAFTPSVHVLGNGTVGYGDYSTATNLGHTLVVTEALLGQLYLVTVIAGTREPPIAAPPVRSHVTRQHEWHHTRECGSPGVAERNSSRTLRADRISRT